MSRLRSAPLVAAVLGLVVLAGAVAALAARQPAVRRAARAATHPPCAPPTAGVHQVVVVRGRTPVLLVVPPGRAVARRPVIVVRPRPGLNGGQLARATGWSGVARRRGALVAYLDASTGDAAYGRATVRALTGNTACGDATRVRWVAGPAPRPPHARPSGYRPAGRRRAHR